VDAGVIPAALVAAEEPPPGPADATPRAAPVSAAAWAAAALGQGLIASTWPVGMTLMFVT
jgi:hypothetical protein